MSSDKSFKVIDISKVDPSKWKFGAIDSKKSFHTSTNIFYENISNEDDTPIYIYIKDFKLVYPMITDYNEKTQQFFKSGKYDKARFKANLSLKERNDIAQQLKLIDDYIEKNIVFNEKMNGLLADKSKYKPSKTYFKLAKIPDASSKDDDENYKGWTVEQIEKDIKEKIGYSLKINLDVKGITTKTEGKPTYTVDYNENSLIECDIKHLKDVNIKIKKNEKKNLEFYFNTFKSGTVIDFVFQIKKWWCKYDSTKKSIETGLKIAMTSIIIKSLSSYYNNIKKLITDDGKGIYDDCIDDEDDDDNDNEDNNKLSDSDKSKDKEKDENVISKIPRKQIKPQEVITGNYIKDIPDEGDEINEDEDGNNDDGNENDEGEEGDDNFDEENNLITSDNKPDLEKSIEKKEVKKEEVKPKRVITKKKITSK